MKNTDILFSGSTGATTQFVSNGKDFKVIEKSRAGRKTFKLNEADFKEYLNIYKKNSGWTQQSDWVRNQSKRLGAMLLP